MGISALTRLMRITGNGISGQLRRTSTLPTEKLMHDFLETLSSKANFNGYSQELKSVITDFVQIGDTNATSFIKTLVDNNAAEKDILNLLKKPEQFNLYRAIKVRLNKLMQNIKFKSPEEKNLFNLNLSLLGVKDKTSFLNLTESKGFSEILEGKLSSEYIRGLKSTDKIGYNHFYDLFASIEKATDTRLSKIVGLDKEGVITLIKSMDKEICESPKVLEDLLVMLEKHKNLDAVNKMLKLFKEDIKQGYVNDEIKKLIEFTDGIEPSKFNKFLKLYEGSYSPSTYRFGKDLESFFSKENKIDQELFEFLVKNKDTYNQFRVGEINDFLSIEGADKNILKKYMDALNKLNENKYVGYDLESVSANNFEYFKKLLEENKINEENYFKLLLTNRHEIFKKPGNWSLADDIYKETFLPIFKSTNEDLWTALNVSGMRICNPETYNKLKTNGIIDLVASKKLKPEILRIGYGQEFIPEVYSDIELLKNGGSVIKHFTSFDKILSKTTAGDVVSVNGKMFINNNGRLEAWNMTEEKFNELFPLVERFAGSQGYHDCFLYSGIESMYRNPKTRGQYYKLFEQKGDDVLVTIPAYKDFKGTIIFNNGEINTGSGSGYGAKHTLMVEQAYARTALRKEVNTPIGKDPTTTEDLEYLYERLDGGQTSDVLRDLLNINPNLVRLKNNRKIAKGVQEVFFRTPKPDNVKKLFDEYGNNPKLMINLGIRDGRTHHAISVKSYNPETGVIEIIDPTRTGVYTQQNLSDLSPNIVKMWFTTV